MEALIPSPQMMRVPYKRYFTTFYFRTPEGRCMVDTIKVWFTGTPHVDLEPRRQVTLRDCVRFYHDGLGNCKAEAELPKLLYGHNGHLLTSQADIEASVTRLREVLFQVVKFESWKLKVVDLVWQFQTRPADVILAYQWIRFPGVRSWPSLERGDKQIHWTGARSRWELKFYDKAKGILRVELRLAGEQLRKRIDDDAPLNFAELYQVFRAEILKLSLVQLPETRKHSLAEIIAALPKELQNAAILAYQQGRTARAASGFKLDVSHARIKKVGWNLRELLPPENPPPAVNVEPRKKRKLHHERKRDAFQ
jgi:hypothetical protein